MEKSWCGWYTIFSQSLPKWQWETKGIWTRHRKHVKANIQSSFGKNHKVFDDYTFTSVALLKKLQKPIIHYTGTTRQKRLPGCTLDYEKSLKKGERFIWSYGQKELGHSSCEIAWQQISHATMNNTRSGTSRGSSALRQEAEKHVVVPMPAIIHN